MPRVTCRAVYCAHNLGGEICNAAEIEINADSRPVNGETDCGTFIPRNFSGSLLSLDNVNYGGLVAQAFSGEHLAHPRIECSVVECRYNENGQKCGAAEIEVTGSHALTSLETKCETFSRNDEFSYRQL